ncbi:TPA: hypothetical protein L5B49_004454 [Pseudomonas aeruginosa]|nr:hypothetical protein [Pseudomonas aeruginosa]
MTLSRLSLAILSVLAGAPAFADDSGVDLDQGWNQTQKTAWLEAGQGSRMLPLAWLVALEQRASEEPLMSDALIRQYGYVPHTLGGSSVKVVQGYAVDRSDDSDLTFTKLRWKALQGSREPWVGPTCSMCHTSHISYQGTQLTVYGGQTMGDLAGFQLEILGALQSTRADTAKFERFARKVLGADGLVSGYNDANKARLQAALDATIVRLRDGSHFNLPHDPEFGPGRLDAIGSIFNSVGYELHADEQIYGAEDAPVSYPFLWNVPQLDRVQWTGFNPNHINVVEIDNRKFDVGALARNAGEAVGVFADVKVLSPIQSALHIGYPSSINVDNLIRIEDQLGQLKPPAWPNQLFGAPEPTRVAEGRELYRQHCSSCHTPLDRNDLRTPVKTVLTHLQARGEVAPIGTDPWTACNSIAQLKTGYVRGKPYLSFVGTGQRGFYGKQAYAVDVLQEVVVQALAARGLSVALGAFQTAALGIFDGQLPPLISPVPDSPDADSASHLREELADLAQMLHPALHAADATGSANLPSPDAAEESSMPPSPSPLAAPAPEPVSARVPSLSLRLRVPPARLAGAEGGANAREAPTQAAAVIRQPEDEAHVDTDTALDIGNDTEHLLQDVQGTLADLAGMAQQLSQQKQEALKQQESLESLQTQLHEKERQLQEKEKQLRQWHKRLQDDRQALERETEQSNRLLAERSAALQQLAESVEARERSSARRAEVLQIEQERLEELRSQQNLRQAELEKREASVQQRSLELGERFKKLESAREKLAQIVKGFNETVQFNTALHAISHTGLKRQEESAAELE